MEKKYGKEKKQRAQKESKQETNVNWYLSRVWEWQHGSISNKDLK